MSKLVVFLGNPGTQYKHTRHNAGWLFSDYIIQETNWQMKFHAMFLKNGNIVYLKPQTFMNESGVSVREAASFFGISSENIIIVHDDIEKPFGNVILEKGGGLRGHNGLRSIVQNLGKDDFMRLRLGIGRPVHADVASYVLGRFTETEEAALPDMFMKAKTALFQEMLK